MTLSDLRKRSQKVVLGHPVLAEAEWATVGQSRRIVTKTRFLQKSDWLRASSPDEKIEDEIIVMTLGGRVGDIGQKVPGEARLLLRQEILLFLGEGQDGHERVIGMSQGAFPVEREGARASLKRSQELPFLVGPRGGKNAPLHLRPAIDVLHRVDFAQAFSLIRGEQ